MRTRLTCQIAIHGIESRSGLSRLTDTAPDRPPGTGRKRGLAPRAPGPRRNPHDLWMVQTPDPNPEGTSWGIPGPLGAIRRKPSDPEVAAASDPDRAALGHRRRRVATTGGVPPNGRIAPPSGGR